jgi:hypothetical protein
MLKAMCDALMGFGQECGTICTSSIPVTSLGWRIVLLPPLLLSPRCWPALKRLMLERHGLYFQPYQRADSAGPLSLCLYSFPVSGRRVFQPLHEMYGSALELPAMYPGW